MDAISGSTNKKQKKKHDPVDDYGKFDGLQTCQAPVSYIQLLLPFQRAMIDDQAMDESKLKYTVGIHPNLIN